MPTAKTGKAVSEKVIDYGPDFVVTEAGIYPNIVRNKYTGKNITENHVAQVKTLEEEKAKQARFEEFEKPQEDHKKKKEFK